MGAHHLVFLEREQYVYFAKPKANLAKNRIPSYLTSLEKKTIELVNNS